MIASCLLGRDLPLLAYIVVNEIMLLTPTTTGSTTTQAEEQQY